MAAEAVALQEAVADGTILRLERRGAMLVVELKQTGYLAGRLGSSGAFVPLLGERREAAMVVTLQCDNYDTDPPAVTFVRDWTAAEELPYEGWPKVSGVIARHHETGKPFLCRRGTREYHAHLQHSDDPWDRYRGRIRPRHLVLDLAGDLCGTRTRTS